MTKKMMMMMLIMMMMTTMMMMNSVCLKCYLSSLFANFHWFPISSSTTTKQHHNNNLHCYHVYRPMNKLWYLACVGLYAYVGYVKLRWLEQVGYM